MKRAQLSTGRERPQLIAARQRMHLSQEEVAERVKVSKSTVHRWEKAGDVPQPLHMRQLCDLFGVSAKELGFSELEGEALPIEPGDELSSNVLDPFRQQQLAWLLMRIVWNWSSHDARYHMLQPAILVELEDNSMKMNRRDALRCLALLPIDLSHLSAAGAVFESSPQEILAQCAAGIVACWQLRKGCDLTFADQAVSSYLPTLRALVQTGPPAQRKAAADLVTQALLLKSILSWAITTIDHSIGYAQQAETYSVMAESRLLQVTALRTKAAALHFAHHWPQALQAAEKAKYLLEQTQKTSSVDKPIPWLVSSYVYSGLATYQASNGRKEDALHSLKKAHKTFFERDASEDVPIWIDHSIGNLLLNDGQAQLQMNQYASAISSLTQIQVNYAQDGTIPLTCRIEATINQVITEASRDDKSRDLHQCIDLWVNAMEGTKATHSNKQFYAAIQAYNVMRAAWPGERQILALHVHIVHW